MAKKLLLTYLFLIVFPLTIFTIISYSIFKNNMETRIAQSVEHNVKLIHNEAEGYFGSLVSLSAQIMQLDGIMEESNMTYLLAERIDRAGQFATYEEYTQNKKIHLYLNTNILDRQRDIKLALIRLTNGETFQSKRTTASIDETVLNQLQQKLVNSSQQWMIQPKKADGDVVEFYLARKINLPGPNRFLGFFVFEVKMNSFGSTLRNSLLSGQEAVVLWQQQSVIYDTAGWWKSHPVDLIHQKGKTLKEKVVNKGRVLITYSSPRDSDWTVVTYIPFSKLSEGIIAIQRTLILAAMICIAIAILIAVLLARNILRPVWALRNAMRLMSKGIFETQVTVKGTDEMAELTHVFNSMSRELSEMINKVYLAELSQKTAELQALQTQIDPHFLYNQLESIRMVAEMQGSPDAGKMLRAMAILFRAATEMESMIPLEKEAILVEQYVMLNEMRLNGPVEFVIELDPSVKLCLVPKFTLQPLLENCLKHGYANWPKGAPILIQLRAFKEAGDLVMDLTDFGAGMSISRIEEVEHALKMSGLQSKVGTSIGLLNVHERIHKRWGSGYGISIVSRAGMGTVVSVQLPCQMHTKEELTHEFTDRG